MARDLLWRGMLAGLFAALIAATFAFVFAEPEVDKAIAFETARHAAMAAMPGMGEAELVSRATQKGAGLYTAMALYGAAVGGLFALVFAYAYGRLSLAGPRTLSLVLAIVAFAVIVLVPALKYPPTPPAVGLHETVQTRTASFFAMIAFSVLSAAGGVWIRRRLAGRVAGLDAVLAGIAGFVVVVAILQLLLPPIDEVSADFPASVLWRFRIASVGAQAVLWLSIGIIFGWLAEQRLRRQ
jgi:predicted cobalt transporter CbtA